MHPSDLVDHVTVSTGLPEAEAARVVEDVVAYFRETTEAYVRRRHRELKTRGRRNAVIWALVSDELAARVVAPPALTERQLRRMVYG